MNNNYSLKLIFLFVLMQLLFACNSSNIQEKDNINNVKVQLSYPSEGIPPLNVYLKDINSGKVYMYENDEGLTLINFEGIPNGEYVAFAYTKDFILGNMKAKGSYSYAVDCGLTVDCKNNRLKKCLINNEYSDTIKIFDWYHEEDIPSEPTTIAKKFGEKKKNESSNSDNNKMVFIPLDKNSEYKKVTVEKLNNNQVNLIEYYKNGEEVSEMGMINNGIIDLDEPDREDFIEINENNLTIENQWVGKVSFELKGGGSKSNTSNKYKIGELRSLVIAGNEYNLINRLGAPNERLSAYNFLDKYYKNKFNIESTYWGSFINHSEIFIYNNLADKSIIVIYDTRNDKVHEVRYKDEVKSMLDVGI